MEREGQISEEIHVTELGAASGNREVVNVSCWTPCGGVSQ